MYNLSNNIYKGFDYLLKGVVVSLGDPKGLKRIQVYIPSIHGSMDTSKVGGEGSDKYPWAQTTYPYPEFILRIHVNDIVILGFEGGDKRVPIYLGLLGKTAPDQIYNINNTLSSKFSGGSINKLASKVVFRNSSNTSISSKSVNNSSIKSEVSVGLMGWSGNQARDILKKIKDSSISTIPSTYDKYLNFDKDWTGFLPSENGQAYNAISYILSLDNSQDVQEQEANKYISEAIEVAKKYNIIEPDAVTYFCDLYLENRDEAEDIATKCSNNIPSVEENGVSADGREVYKNTEKTISNLHNTVLSGGYLLGSYINDNNIKRKEAFDLIQTMVSSGEFDYSPVTPSKNSIEFPMRYPVDYKYGIALNFGDSIRVRTLRGYEYISHNGIDITGTDICGKQVYSVFNDGHVIEVGNNRSKGNYAIIVSNYSSYSNGNRCLVVEFSNLDKVEVSSGESVNYNSVIGYVGFTGNTTGALLHMTACIYDDGEPLSYVNPVPYFIKMEDY